MTINLHAFFMFVVVFGFCYSVVDMVLTLFYSLIQFVIFRMEHPTPNQQTLDAFYEDAELPSIWDFKLFIVSTGFLVYMSFCGIPWK